MNNGYYFVVALFSGDVLNIIYFNQFIFALTNVFIFSIFGIKFSEMKVIHVLILFLPYRLHLASHVLKDTLIIYMVLLSYFCAIRFLLFPLIVTFIFRIVAGPIVLMARFIPERRWYIFAVYLVFALATFISPDIASFLLDRSEASMGGRDYFEIPLSDATSLTGIIGKTILWPFLAKTGMFALVSLHPTTFILAFECFVFLLFAIYYRKTIALLTGNGLIALIFVALMVNSYGAYYRYVYPFLIVDYIVFAMLIFGRNDSKEKLTKAEKLKVTRS